MDDMFGMQYSISVENQPYPVLCTLSPDGCTAHVPDFPKITAQTPTLDAALLEQGNGYITTRAVTEQVISKPYFAEYVRSRELERVAHGVYQSPDAWPDDMYILHLRNSNMIFSHQSALALHGMMEREPHYVYVSLEGRWLLPRW